MPQDRFRILFVCTGNICRSPMAEALVRQAAGSSPEADRVVVESAGVHGFDNAAMEPRAVDALRHLGATSASFRSRRVTPSMVAAADLVLVAGLGHRATVLSLEPRALNNCFTMLEFARLARDIDAHELTEGDIVARGKSLVSAAVARRGHLAPARRTDDELADPYGGSVADFRACADQIVAALDWLHLLAPRTNAPGDIAGAR